MKSAVAWFVRNPVAANLLVVIIFVGGFFGVYSLRQEIFPEFSADQVSITVKYPGAAPEEVEEGVCVRVEEAIHGLDGMKRITSTAFESVGSTMVEVLPGHESRKVLDDIKTRVDAIDTFPKDTEKPEIKEIMIRNQVIAVGIAGKADEKSLKRIGEQVRDEISNLPGITQVELISTRPYEISIEVSEAVLRRYGMSLDEVASAVRQSSLDLPGGSVKTEGGEILVRVKGQAYVGIDFENIVLRTLPDGTRLRLGDVATIVDGFEETDQAARLDGEPAVIVQVFRVGEQSALKIADAVKAYLQEAQTRMPNGIKLMPWQDYSKFLRGRLDTLLNDTRVGFLLVFALLAMFLKFRLAWWVSFGIPIAFLGALALMPFLDVSISMISLFAFILVLGVVVDDAIVIGENIYTRYQKGDDGITAAIRGTQEVMVPVTFGVLTTAAAFFPMLFIGGNTGKIMRVIPLIVIPTLLISLVEALICLPVHLRHVDKKQKEHGISARWAKIQEWFGGKMDLFVRRVYRPLLERALTWRYLTIAIALTVFMFTLGLIGGGRIKFVFFPNVEADDAGAFLTMPQGTPKEVTFAAIKQLEEAALQVQREMDATKATHDGSSVIRHIHAAVGEQPFRTMMSRNAGGTGKSYVGSHLGEVHFELAPSEVRNTTGAAIVKRWRELASAVPGAVELTFLSSVFSAGEAVNVQLTGLKLDELRHAADELKTRLAEFPGVVDITDSFRGGKQEVKLKIKPAAQALGLTLEDLARQVRQGFYGEETQTIQRGRDEVKVFVRYPEAERRSLGDLENMRIRTRDGSEVPFSAVAEAELGRGFASIKRVDRNRAINVTADVDEARGNANEINLALTQTVLPDLLRRHPGVRYTYEGERREQGETMSGLIRGFIITLFVIYALLAIPLSSYLQPFLVMSAIPFGVVGAVWGHVIMGIPVSVLSVFGIVALAGMVVNDSLVLVDFINQRRKAGATLGQAVREAGASRFRPIVLISGTTFLGLAPLILERSVQAQFLVPMSVSLGFGCVASTAISLLVVPCLYLVLEDLKGWRRKPAGSEAPVFVSASPRHMAE